MEWISVGDRLPEFDGEFLVKFRCSPFKPSGMEVCNFTNSVKPSFSHDRFHITKVTHWMPLPEPPSESES